jgi:3-oxoadipate enol-lactonase
MTRLPPRVGMTTLRVMSTVVFVHAFGSSSRAWTPQLAAFSDRHRVLAPDLPGHGEAADTPFTLDRAVDRVHATIAEAGGEAGLIGISGGAVVALLACLEHPTQVAWLVLSAGLARPPRWFAVQRALARITPEALLIRLLAGTYSGGNASHAGAAAEDLRRCGKPTYLAGLRELSALDLRSRLGQVTVPTLVLCGSKDRANIPLSRGLATGLPTAQLEIIPGATHLWNLQQPEVFNQTVAAFIDAPDLPAAGSDPAAGTP